jgi:hypothetical protein
MDPLANDQWQAVVGYILRLRDHARVHGSHFNNEASIQLADYIINVCYQEMVITMRPLVQLWLRSTVSRVNQDLFNQEGFGDHQLHRINDLVCHTGRAVREYFCSNSKHPTERRQYTIQLLQSMPASGVEGSLERQCLEMVLQVQDADFGKPLNKEQDVLSQAAAVVMLFIKDTPLVLGCQYPTMDAFRADVGHHVLRNLRTMLQECSEGELNLIKLNAEFMKIIRLIITVERGKGRYMSIAAGLSEGKQYITGGGNFPASQRREKMFEVISGVIAVPRTSRVKAKVSSVDVQETDQSLSSPSSSSSASPSNSRPPRPPSNGLSGIYLSAAALQNLDDEEILPSAPSHIEKRELSNTSITDEQVKHHRKRNSGSRSSCGSKNASVNFAQFSFAGETVNSDLVSLSSACASFTQGSFLLIVLAHIHFQRVEFYRTTIGRY